MDDNKTKFTRFANAFLEKSQNQLASEEQAAQNLTATIANSARAKALCEQASNHLKELGLSEQQQSQVSGLMDAFYLAGFGDGIDFTVNHAEPSLNLGAAFLTERYKSKVNGDTTHAQKPLALRIAQIVSKERPELKISDIVRITYKRMSEDVKAEEMPAEKTIRRWVDQAQY